MGPAYLILSGPTEPMDVVAAILGAEGWRQAGACGTASVWTPVNAQSPVLASHATAIVLGHGFHPREAAPCRLMAPTDRGGPSVERLLKEAWGEYVALLAHDAGHILLRDPSGGVECLTWRTREGVNVAAPDLLGIPGWLRPQRLSLNWDRIAAFLNATSAGASSSLFDDIVSLPPGGVAELGDGRTVRLAWRPARFVADPITDLQAAETELVRRVDAATAGLVEGHERLLVEISGGLDSSIVATSLAATGHLHRVATWYNAVSDRRDGDESRYAGAVADKLGVTPTFVDKLIEPLRVVDFQELAQGFRPATGGVDARTDRDMAERIRAISATGVLAGQGGDAVFYQMPSSYLITDLLRRDGLGALASADLGAMARRRRQSVWQVLREGWDARRLKVQAPRVNRLLTPAAAAHAVAGRHAWETDSLDLSLSKQLHVRGLAQAHATRTYNRRTLVAPLLCPLMSQPVTELCLAIPAVDLALGLQDRPLARRAFGERLPDVVRTRRSKGEITAYFARVMAASADELRPYLLDGNLAAAGVLDRRAVAQALDPEQLLHAPRPSELLIAAATEAWVRYWQTRAPDAPSRGPWRR